MPLRPVPDLTARARVLKALAHPSRLAMLTALEQGERCVCELRDLVGADLSTVSRHLALMKAAGLVSDRKQGVQVYYRLRVACILRLLDCVDAVLADAARPSRALPATVGRARAR